MITKKQYKKIAKGDYGALMAGIEDLINHFKEDVFTNGYNAALSDMDVLSTRLADRISDVFQTKQKDDDGVFWLDYEDLVETIKNFYKEQLNGKEREYF